MDVPAAIVKEKLGWNRGKIFYTEAEFANLLTLRRRSHLILIAPLNPTKFYVLSIHMLAGE